MNLEAYGQSSGKGPLASVYPQMAEELEPNLIRFGLDLKNPKGLLSRAREVFEVLGTQVWLSLWDLPDPLVENPKKATKRKAKSWPIVAGKILDALEAVKNATGHEVAYFSVNEPVLTSRLSGGYNLLLSPDDQFLLLSLLSEGLEERGLSTKLIIGLYHLDSDSLDYLRKFLEQGPLPTSVVAVDAHSYWFENERDFLPKEWESTLASPGLGLFCGEWEFDNRFWLNPSRTLWQPPLKEIFEVTRRLMYETRVSRMLPWYRGTTQKYPSRQFAVLLSRALAQADNLIEVTGNPPGLSAIAVSGRTATCFYFNGSAFSYTFVQDLAPNDIEVLRFSREGVSLGPTLVKAGNPLIVNSGEMVMVTEMTIRNGEGRATE